MNTTITKEEKKLLTAFERGEFKSVADLGTRKGRIARAARSTLLKNQRVNIRMREDDLVAIKKKAEEHGLPYQTLISALLHHYASGKINLMF